MTSPFSRSFVFAALLSLSACVGSQSALRTAEAPAQPQVVEPRAFIWEVTPAGAPERRLYLAGSIHVGPDGLELPPSMQQAFDRAGVLVVEVDPTEADPNEMQRLIVSLGTWPAGDGLQNHVAPETMELLAQVLPKVQLPLEAANRFRPWLLATTLVVLDLQRAGYSGQNGIDAQLLAQARTADKRILELETMESQLTMLAAMPDEVQDLMLRETLEQSELAAMSLATALSAWQGGNAVAMSDALRPRNQNPLYAPLYKAVFTDRNLEMTKKISALLDAPETHFVVVGAGHLVGDDGIVALLQQRGFAVRQLPRAAEAN